jgi:hypothetical protein
MEPRSTTEIAARFESLCRELLSELGYGEASIVNRGGREVTDFVGTEPGTGRRLVADQYFEIPGNGTEVTLCVRTTKSEAGARVIDDIWRDSVNILRKNPVDESRKGWFAPVTNSTSVVNWRNTFRKKLSCPFSS